MKNISLWIDTVKEKRFSKLNKDLDVDVLIIGGGLTGVSTLYNLKDTNLKVCLAERNKIGHGVTSKTTGKINYLQGIVYSKIKKGVGEDSAKKYLESQLEGIKEIKRIIEKEGIECNLEQVTSYLYGEKKDELALEEEYLFLKENNIDVKKEKNTLKVQDTYVFHPLKYLWGLINAIEKNNPLIFENTKIVRLEKFDEIYQCYTDEKNIIKAKKVILACHYPFEIFPFFLPLRTYIEKSYVIARKIKDNPQETWITTYPSIHSKRYLEDKENIFEIELSGSHNTCTKLNHKEHFRKLVQDKNPEYIWSNEDIMTADNLPFIGYLNETLILATGYNTWGMITSVVASLIIKDLILNKENKYLKYFEPLRKMNLAKLKQEPINLMSNMKSYTENKIFKKKDWYPKNLTFKTINGKNIATWKDGKKEYSVYTACPHVGCTLLFNEIEKTWDCPCHASRFDITGKCIKGPSIYNITYKEDDFS